MVRSMFRAGLLAVVALFAAAGCTVEGTVVEITTRNGGHFTVYNPAVVQGGGICRPGTYSIYRDTPDKTGLYHCPVKADGDINCLDPPHVIPWSSITTIQTLEALSPDEQRSRVFTTDCDSRKPVQADIHLKDKGSTRFVLRGGLLTGDTSEGHATFRLDQITTIDVSYRTFTALDRDYESSLITVTSARGDSTEYKSGQFGTCTSIVRPVYSLNYSTGGCSPSYFLFSIAGVNFQIPWNHVQVIEMIGTDQARVMFRDSHTREVDLTSTVLLSGEFVAQTVSLSNGNVDSTRLEFSPREISRIEIRPEK